MLKVISWTGVILWMRFIFYLSSQPGTVSNGLSTGVTKFIIRTVNRVTHNKEFDIKRFNYIIRKNAHFFIYLVLGVFLINAFRASGVYGYRGMALALLICVLYAISDEVHQMFVPGRGPRVKDVLIDSAGAMVGIGAYILVVKIFMIKCIL